MYLALLATDCRHPCEGWPVGGAEDPIQMLDRELLDVLACPSCLGELRYEPEQERLVCPACRLAFPIHDDIPDLLREDARPLDADPSAERAEGS